MAETDEFAERLWSEIRGIWPAHAKLYANVHRAIHVFGDDAAERVANFHVARAKAEGAIR